MEMKHAILAFAAIAALGAVFVCINAEDNSAANTDTVTYHVNVNETERTLNLILNENYFQSIDSNHTVNWSYLGESDYESLLLDTTYTLNGCQFTLSKKTGETVGEYLLTLKAESSNESTVVLKIRCTITINIDDKTGGDREYVTDPLYITVNVSLNSGNNLPTDFNYTITGQSGFISRDSIMIKEGVPVSMTPNITGDAGQFIWYAVNLPKGLAMTSSGVITGVPVEHNYTPTESKVYVEDLYGNSKTFDLKIVVIENNLNITYYLSPEKLTPDTDLDALVHEPSQYMTQRDKNVTLAIASKDVKVSVVSSDGELERTNIERTETVTIGITEYYCYTLPTDGTGMYRVIISDEHDVKLSAFDLYVMSRLLAVQSEIIVGSDGTS